MEKLLVARNFFAPFCGNTTISNNDADETATARRNSNTALKDERFSKYFLSISVITEH